MGFRVYRIYRVIGFIGLTGFIGFMGSYKWGMVTIIQESWDRLRRRSHWAPAITRIWIGIFSHDKSGSCTRVLEVYIVDQPMC